MSEVEEKNLEISQEELDKLPKDTVHCFPASKKQILKRRIITLIIAALDAAAAGSRERPIRVRSCGVYSARSF